MLAVLLLNRMTMKRRIARKQSLSKPVKVEAKAPDIVFCRTCLSTDGLESIFTSKDHEKKRSHELKLITGLEIKLNDGLSQKICNKCITKLSEALQFRRTSRKAEKSLLGMVEGCKSKRKYKLRKKVIKTIKIKENKEETFEAEYDFGGEDFQNDYGDDKDIQDSYQNEKIENNDGFNAIKEEESVDNTKSKPASKRKRQSITTSPPYKCGTCNKEFRMKATFKAHMRFHTNYCVCEACGKRCRNNNQLQEHKRARHGLGRIHKCAYCEYSSATKEALTIHERRHTGERPYVCDHCGATFHRRSNLVQHIAIHLPEKNFQCEVCNKREKSKKLLRVHQYKVHQLKRYKYLCPVCRTEFSRPGNVRDHLVRTHGVMRASQGPIERLQIQPSIHQTGESNVRINIT